MHSTGPGSRATRRACNPHRYRRNPTLITEPVFQHIRAHGITLRTLVKGEGPLVILLHRFPEFWHLWRHPINPIVAAGYKPTARGARIWRPRDAFQQAAKDALANLAACPDPQPPLARSRQQA